MKRMSLALLLMAATVSTPALAGDPDVRVTQRNPNVVDVAATPANDLNLRKEAIPPILVAAQQRPYDLRGLGSCPAIASQVGKLDTVLGSDIDLGLAESRKIQVGRVAQSVVGSFIPFRGIIREVSGANHEQRMLQNAVEAGIARRSFLKGVGEARGCRYPARSATPAVIAQLDRQAQARDSGNPKK